MTDELSAAKRRLRTAGHSGRHDTPRDRNVAQAKEDLRSAAQLLTGYYGGSVAERIAVQQLGDWVRRSPWQAILAALATGTLLGSRGSAVLCLVARMLDIALAESLSAQARSFRPPGASEMAAASDPPNPTCP